MNDTTRRIRPGAPVLAALLALAALGSPAPAEFRLASQTARADGSVRAEVVFEPRPVPENFRDFAFVPADLAVEMGLSDPEGDGVRFERSEPPAGWDRESFLLAAPGVENVEVRDWTVSAEAFAPLDGEGPAEPLSADGAVTAKAVRLGPVAALQVEIDPNKFRDASGTQRRAARARLAIQGPASAMEAPRSGADSMELPDSMRRFFLNGEQLSVWRARRTPGRGAGALPEPPGDFRVSYRGGDQIIRVPLADIGMSSPADLDQAAILHHGALLPAGGVDGTDAWFYAPRRETLSDISDAVFVKLNASSPSGPMDAREAFTTLSPQSVEVAYDQTRLYDPNLRYEWVTIAPVGESFNFYRARNPGVGSEGPTTNFGLPFHDLLTNLTLDFEFVIQGLNNFDSTSPDHQAIISVEGAALPQLNWDGQVVTTQGASVTLPGQPSGGLLTFSHVVPTPVFAADLQGLDTIEISWTGKPRVDGDFRDTLNLGLAGDGMRRLVTVGGFPAGTLASDVMVIEIEGPDKFARLLNLSAFPDETGGVAVEFEAPPGPIQYQVELFAQSAAPDSAEAPILLPSPPPPGTPLKGIVVRPPSLAASLAPLLAQRGAGYIEMDPRAAYDAYNGGQQSPEAIQSALSDLVAAAPERVPLPYIILAGHGSLDRRDYLGFQSGAQIPPFIEKSVSIPSGQVENSLDYPFGLLEGADNVLDAIVGRIPARTPDLVDEMVSRTLAQEALHPTLYAENRAGLILLDNDSEFQGDGPTWVSLWEQTGRPAIFYSLASTSAGTVIPAIEQAFEDPAEGGVAWAMYIGHGNSDTWAGEHLVTPSSVPDHATQNQWPTVSTFTCLNHFYAFPDPTNPAIPNVSLGEAWLFEPNNGAVVSIAPTSLDYYFSQRLFAESVMNQLALPEGQRPRTSGAAMAEAQIDFAIAFPGLIATNKEYLFFGDPGTSLTLTSALPVELSLFGLE